MAAYNSITDIPSQGRWQKNFQVGGGQRKKDRKIAIIPKNSTIKPLPGGGEPTEKSPKTAKKTENSTFKPLSTIWPPPPAADVYLPSHNKVLP